MSPEKVVTDDAAELDAALSVIAGTIFGAGLPTPRVVVTFPDIDRDGMASVIRAFPKAGWRFHSGLSSEWWHGSIGPVSIHLDPVRERREPTTTEEALAALLGGDE